MEIAASEVTMEPACEALPEAGEETLIPDIEMDTKIGVMKVPAGEGLGASGVRLDVVGLDAVVTVDTTLLASPERDKESRTQKLSAYLSTRFYRTPTPRVAYLETPTWEAIPEENPLQTQAEGLSHSAVERIAEAVERAMGVQQEDPVALEVGMREAFLADVAALAT